MNPSFNGADRYGEPQQSVSIDASNVGEVIAKEQVLEAQRNAKQAEQVKAELAAMQSKNNTATVTPVYNDLPSGNYEHKTSNSLVDKPKQSIREQIAELEKELGSSPISYSKKAPSSNSYIDDLGDETFYVENISGGHVVISDIDMKRIDRGEVMDLLQFGDLDTIKKSRDLRVALSGYGSEKLLNRLTPEEFLHRIQKQVESKKKIELFKLTSSVNKDSVKEADILRPVIESRLEKLRNKAISPVEFISWVQTEKLTIAELDAIMGLVQDNDIRSFILEKKKGLM